MNNKAGRTLAGLLGLIVTTAPLQVTAQSFGDAFKGVGDNNDPINVESDRLEIDDKKKTALLTGNVRVIQGKSVVTGTEMRVFYLRKGEDNKTKSGVDRIEINGNVKITSGQNTASADKATVNLIKNSATLTGNVILTQGENRAEACSLWVDLETRNTKLNHSCKQRIKIVASQSGDEEQ